MNMIRILHLGSSSPEESDDKKKRMRKRIIYCTMMIMSYTQAEEGDRENHSEYYKYYCKQNKKSTFKAGFNILFHF